MAKTITQYELQRLMGIFMEDINSHIQRTKALSEPRLIIALLKAAHCVEARSNINNNFEAIATKYIARNFGTAELSNKVDICKLAELLN